MSPKIKQECIELEDISIDCVDLVSEEYCSSPDEEQSPEQDDQVNPRRQPASRSSIHVSVHRGHISAAQVQEGTDELQGLGVDVYDQQTYERNVFDQVDRAISGPSASSSAETRQANRPTTEEQPNSSNIGDLMRLIHDQNQAADQTGEQDSIQARDEQILQLTRQQRLNRPIKIELCKKEPEVVTNSLPRVPKISKKQSDTIASTQSSSLIASTSGIQKHSIKQEVKVEHVERSFLDEDLEEAELSSLEGDESSKSEYRPNSSEESQDEFDDINEDIVYETDSDADNGRFDKFKERAEAGTKSKKIKDDGDLKSYAIRIKAHNKMRARTRMENIDEDGFECNKLDEMVKIDGSLQILKDIWENLFEHQKTGVRWLWELHQLGTGGILGDEMGLGKTIQMIAFLVALKNSRVNNLHNNYDNLGPTVLVCPATVMHQWLQEFRKWYPPFRVAILHSTGTFSGDKKQLVKVIHKSNGILICSYPGVIIYQDYLHALDWHYAILDEGHKIKNPDSLVTLACKRFRTPHRIILSGSPVQNNLRELWSIFDFIYPGKLGTLPVFLGQFAIPITQGGYANATDMQVQIAYKCACVLRDTIKPFLLRRTKAEVNSKLKLPERSEQVLFCKLTEKQRKLYQHFLESPTVRDIKRGKLQIFVGLIHLRKICNHPDIFDASECNRQVRSKNHEKKLERMEYLSTEETFGHFEKSGKMMVVDALLKLWKKQGDKVLLFTQSRQMLKIFEQYMDERGYKYLKMDGSTPIGSRHTLIDEFNNNEEIFVFLLTTRVGGVGVNLTGANRIIIYDPDWNPSTDIQARERAWRIGQQRHVIIYRLLTAGTIEEKIYHRQVFKLYLTNRILKDPKQKRFFKTNDLHELFALGHDDKNIETKALFDDDLQINEKSIKRSKKKDKKRKRRNLSLTSGYQNSQDETQNSPLLSDEKLQKMREQAKRLSQMISLKYGKQQKVDDGAVGATVEEILTRSNDNLDIEPLQLLDDDVPDCMQVYDSASSSIQPWQPDFSGEPSEKKSRVNQVSRSSRDLKPKREKKQRVEYLVKQDVYKPALNDTDGDNNRESRYKRDDYILGRLFKNSNISGALKHDRIENDSTADFKVVESEAEKVARDAIRALRESRRFCLGSTSGIPNWTGRNGQVASSSGINRLVPKNKARAEQFAMSTKATPSTSNKQESILSSIKKRNQSNPVIIRNGQNGASIDSDDEETDRDFRGRASEVGAESIADKISQYLRYQSSTRGEAQTGELLEFFKRTFKPDKTAIFKAILYKMCEFHRRGDQGFWKLRDEFRSL